MCFVRLQHLSRHLVGARDKDALVGTLFSAHLCHVAALLEIQAGAVVDTSFFHGAVFAKGRAFQTAAVDGFSPRHINALRNTSHLIFRNSSELNAGVYLSVPVDVGLSHSQHTDVTRPVLRHGQYFFLKGIEINVLSPAKFFQYQIAQHSELP